MDISNYFDMKNKCGQSCLLFDAMATNMAELHGSLSNQKMKRSVTLVMQWKYLLIQEKLGNEYRYN